MSVRSVLVWSIALAPFAGACTCDDLPPPQQDVGEVRQPVQNPKVPPLPNGCLPQPNDAQAPAYTFPGHQASMRIMAYGHDLSDKSGVAWNQPYPSPCLDDRPPRRGYPNAAWHGNYTVEGNEVCLLLEALYAHYPPKNELQLGYTVELAGKVAFEDGTTRKNVVMLQFRGVPMQTASKKCLMLKFPEGGAPAGTTTGEATGAAPAAAPEAPAAAPEAPAAAPEAPAAAPKGPAQ